MTKSKPKSLRLRRFTISTPVLTEILKMAAKNALPKDAKVRGVYFEALRDGFMMVVESEEFSEVQEGSEIPLHGDPIMSTTFMDILRGRNQNKK